MRKALFTVFLLAPALAAADKPNPGDYTVAIHVQSSRFVSQCYSDTKGATCSAVLWLNALIDGKKVELESEKPGGGVLRVGDYKARVLKENSSKSYVYSRTYEFLFSDGTTRKYDVVGESE